MIALPPPRHPGFTRSCRAVAESLFTAPGREVPSERLDWVAAEVDDIAAHAGTRGRWLLRIVAFLLSYLAPFFVGKVGHLASLPRALRTVALTRMEDGPAAPLVMALKAILCTVYYEHPDAAREVGWNGCAPKELMRVDPKGARP